MIATATVTRTAPFLARSVFFWSAQEFNRNIGVHNTFSSRVKKLTASDWNKMQSKINIMMDKNARNQLLHKYWMNFLYEFDSKLKPVKKENLLSSSYIKFNTGLNGVELLTSVAYEGGINVEVCFLGFSKDDAEKLRSYDNYIQKSLGYDVEWTIEEYPQVTIRWITATLAKAKVRDKKDWKRQHKWLAKTLQEFQRTILPLFDNL